MPINYVLLLVFTLCESYIVACCCAAYSPEIVLTAAVMTAAMVIALTLFAVSGIADFTLLWCMAFIVSMTMLTLVIMTWIVGYPIFYTGWCALAVVLFGIYLVIDT